MNTALERIFGLDSLALLHITVCHLRMSAFVQVIDEYIAIQRLALVSRNIRRPAPDRTRHPCRDALLLREFGDREEIRANGEQDGSRFRQTPKGLAFGS